jgi:hypothetical protein
MLALLVLRLPDLVCAPTPGGRTSAASSASWQPPLAGLLRKNRFLINISSATAMVTSNKAWLLNDMRTNRKSQIPPIQSPLGKAGEKNPFQLTALVGSLRICARALAIAAPTDGCDPERVSAGEQHGQWELHACAGRGRGRRRTAAGPRLWDNAVAQLGG